MVVPGEVPSVGQTYEDPPLDEESVGTSLVPVESRLTMIDVDAAAAAYKAYLELCRRILDENDYATIRGIKARKRSGWAKLRRFYGISTRIVWEQRVPSLPEWEPGQSFVYVFTVSGNIGKRWETADGTCESSELEGSNIEPTEHNVRAKALTRAKNRVTSDLIGGGEVSAEELNAMTPRKKSPEKKHWIDYGKARGAFWAFAHTTLGLTDKDVYEALGVDSVHDFEGNMEDAKKALEAYIEEKLA